MKNHLLLIIISLAFAQEVDLSLDWAMADDVFYSQQLDSVIENQISDLLSIKGIIVIHKGRVVAENYYNGSSVDDIFNIWSVTKSFTSTLIGQAIDLNLIHHKDSSLVHFLPDHGVTYLDSIDLNNILSMTSGYQDEFDRPDLYNVTTQQLVSMEHGSPGNFL